MVFTAEGELEADVDKEDLDDLVGNEAHIRHGDGGQTADADLGVLGDVEHGEVTKKIARARPTESCLTQESRQLLKLKTTVRAGTSRIAVGARSA